MFQQIWASRGGNEHGMRFASTGTMHDETKLAYNCIYVSIELHLYLEICVMYIPATSDAPSVRCCRGRERSAQ